MKIFCKFYELRKENNYRGLKRQVFDLELQTKKSEPGEGLAFFCFYQIIRYLRNTRRENLIEDIHESNLTPVNGK
jgi:hypothetical protein